MLGGFYSPWRSCPVQRLGALGMDDISYVQLLFGGCVFPPQLGVPGLLFSLHLIPTLVYNESPTQGNINSFIVAAYNHGRVFDSEELTQKEMQITSFFFLCTTGELLQHLRWELAIV